LPYDFAAHLFDLTKLGMRVIVAPSDVAPVSIAHPVYLSPGWMRGMPPPPEFRKPKKPPRKLLRRGLLP
jgi:hypothetical protein